MRALIAGFALAATTPALADVKTGVDAWEAGDFAGAVAEWRPLAVAGDPDAQFNLAQAYKLGRGAPQDLNIAEDWYRKAAQKGHAQAEDNLGLILFQNNKRQEAMPWIRKSADRGEPRAQYVLGTAMFNGDLAEKDWPRAYALMTRSSAQGITQATASLAQMDKYLSANDRTKGIALARTMAAAQPGPPPAPAAQAGLGTARAPIPMAPRPAKPAIAATQLPPSQVGAGYAPPPAATPSASPRPVQMAAASRPAPPPAPKPAPAPAAPKPRVAPPVAAATVAASTGGWRVQLGAFSDEGRARALWSRSATLEGFAALQPAYEKAGAITRLRAGPVETKAAAEKLCATAKAAGNACLIVAP
ncbi:MAG: hypothetical protein DI623_11085 [Sphingomonas sanxanigenens]|uniref:SPOR domain-containing protein n=1 Tax=Sphingomonas sanxanigenens TaxID=397260 RepID=A0A2W5A7J0_9SPHN|nr:MAG: hypothetical protein DI623_11085 [Sphingomonas sanxanigenens]